MQIRSNYIKATAKVYLEIRVDFLLISIALNY